MTEYERVREKIAGILSRHGNSIHNQYTHGGNWEDAIETDEAIDQILSLVEIKSDDQSLPFCEAAMDCEYGHFQTMQRTQQDMLKPDSEGRVWVRVIPKPK